jgi:hypothetical protein
MPSYDTLSPAVESTPEPYNRVCAVSADPLAQQASSHGNAFMLDQAAVATPRSSEQWAANPALLPLYEMLNDPSVSPAARAEVMLRYRNQNLAAADLGTMAEMASGTSDMPLSLEAGKEGAHFPLYERLGQDPAMQQLVLDLSQRALAMQADQVDIEALWEGTRVGATALAGPEQAQQASLMALQAMATFMNAQKFARDKQHPIDPGTGLPQDMPEGVTPELWATGLAATRHVASAPTPDAAVMSHGVNAQKTADDIPFTADNNYHFWTHAWLCADLQAEQGLSPEQAEAISAVAGAQYELKPRSFQEEHGNAGLKDILMNAEGAAFGSDLLRDPSAPLPGQDHGPPFDTRALGPLDEIDPATQAVLDRADIGSAEGMLDALIDGVLANDQDAGRSSCAGERTPRPLF